MVILVDLDGTVVHYDFPKLIKKWFKVEVPDKLIQCYSLEEALGVPTALIAEMFEAAVFYEPEFVPGALAALRSFISNGHEVGIYSNRLIWMTTGELSGWMEKHSIPYTGIETNKTLPSYVHAFVDDSPVKLMNVDYTIEVKNLILLDQPWNRKCLNIMGRMQRAKNWAQVRGIIKG